MEAIWRPRPATSHYLNQVISLFGAVYLILELMDERKRRPGYIFCWKVVVYERYKNCRLWMKQLLKHQEVPPIGLAPGNGLRS